MSVWVVRAGRYGEQEEGALNFGVITIRWRGLPSLVNVKTKEELQEVYLRTFPDATKMQAANEIGQIWRFINEIKKGDLVLLPLKTRSEVAIGEVEGDYEYRELSDVIKHIRKVKWLKIVPRSAFDEDFLYSLNARMTVFQIQRKDAEVRVRSLLKEIKLETERVTEEVKKLQSLKEMEIDIEQYAMDKIVKYIERKFKGHDFARLVEAVLKAQGYVTLRSLPGPDGGVDILAGAGPLGLDAPRICVQVKSTTSPVDVKVLRELQGVMSKFNATQGLLVSWGGFTESALKEARGAFFNIRLWDSGDLIKAILKYYDGFSNDLKAELPLKKIWILVEEEEEE